MIDGQLQSAARYLKEEVLRIQQALEDRRSGFFVQEGDLSEGLDVSRGDCDLVLLHGCPCTGITLGWIWIDSPSPAGENVTCGNRIEFVMQVLSDGRGIDTLRPPRQWPLPGL